MAWWWWWWWGGFSGGEPEPPREFVGVHIRRLSAGAPDGLGGISQASGLRRILARADGGIVAGSASPRLRVVRAQRPTVTASHVALGLAWDEGPFSESITGYIVSYGVSSGSYPHTRDVGMVTFATIAELVSGVRYYFVVRAYNAVGLSEPSNEVSGVGH